MADQQPEGQSNGPTEEETGGYDRWSQPSVVGRRGLVLAVLIPLLIAGCGFAIVSWVSRDSGDSGTVLRVPTSAWKSGQDTGSTPIQGTLEASDERCLYLVAADGTQTWPVWPGGYTARINDDGLVGLYDGSNHLVARDGQELQMSGEVVPGATYAGDPCLPPSGDVVEVQSEITVRGS